MLPTRSRIRRHGPGTRPTDRPQGVPAFRFAATPPPPQEISRQPLMPVIGMPWVKYRWPKANSRITGRVKTVAAAMR